MKRCVIVGGADISNYEWVCSHLKKNDYMIFCDSGLKHMNRIRKKPDLIVGDFDSHENPELPVETIVLPCEKDDTDTVFATKEAIRRGFSDFILIGVIGQRFDHTIGNVSILLMLNSINKKAIIIDDYSEMTIVADKAYIDEKYKYFSLLNIGGLSKGISVQNAKYPLNNAEISNTYQYGISNEVLPGSTATVSISEGILLLVKTIK